MACIVKPWASGIGKVLFGRRQRDFCSDFIENEPGKHLNRSTSIVATRIGADSRRRLMVAGAGLGKKNSTWRCYHVSVSFNGLKMD